MMYVYMDAVLFTANYFVVSAQDMQNNNVKYLQWSILCLVKMNIMARHNYIR